MKRDLSYSELSAVSPAHLSGRGLKQSPPVCASLWRARFSPREKAGEVVRKETRYARRVGWLRAVPSPSLS